MDQHQSVGGPYNVRGFPTIKIFGANKQAPSDYNGKSSSFVNRKYHFFITDTAFRHKRFWCGCLFLHSFFIK